MKSYLSHKLLSLFSLKSALSGLKVCEKVGWVGEGEGAEREEDEKKERADILLSRKVICNERLLRNVFIP